MGPSDSEPRLRACVPAENCVSTSASAARQWTIYIRDERAPVFFSETTHHIFFRRHQISVAVLISLVLLAVDDGRDGRVRGARGGDRESSLGAHARDGRPRATLRARESKRRFWHVFRRRERRPWGAKHISRVSLLQATAPTTVTGATSSNVDDLEFRIDAAKEFVFYRSASRDAVFFFPPQNLYSVPLSDGGTNRARLEALRVKLGLRFRRSKDERERDAPSSEVSGTQAGSRSVRAPRSSTTVRGSTHRSNASTARRALCRPDARRSRDGRRSRRATRV